MRKTRKLMFETNSSMVHSLCICSEEEYEAFKRGEMMYNYYNDTLVETSKVPEWGRNIHQYLTFEKFKDLDFMHFEESKKMNNGTTVIAFGYYGHD